MTNIPEKRGGPGRGGRRAGAGRPQQRINLDLATANILREIVRLRTLEGQQDIPEFRYTPNQAVEDLIYGEALRRGMLEPGQRDHWFAVARGEQPPAE